MPRRMPDPKINEATCISGRLVNIACVGAVYQRQYPVHRDSEPEPDSDSDSSTDRVKFGSRSGSGSQTRSNRGTAASQKTPARRQRTEDRGQKTRHSDRLEGGQK